MNVLVCPDSKRRLVPRRLDALETDSGRFVTRERVGTDEPPAGATSVVLCRDDASCAYPMIGSTPILLAPEMLVPAGTHAAIDVADHRYAEAYHERGHYNLVAKRETRAIPDKLDTMLPALQASQRTRETFPAPPSLWLDAPYDCAAQWEGYKHLAPVKDARTLQLGGKGSHAIKFLLAGAAEGWLVTPMEGEAEYATALAEAAGVSDRFKCVVAVGEELPFCDGSLDVIYAGGCVHHMATELAFPEVVRVLSPGGRFAAIEPWRAPLYGLGTRLLGKRESDVFCRPLTPERMRPFREAFRDGRVSHHGALTRYGLLALGKLGVRLPLEAIWRITALDDRISSRFPSARAQGSSVALLGKT